MPNRLFGGLKSGTAIVVAFSGALILGVRPASADPLGAGSGAIYRLGPEASFQEGCWDPCLCPILNSQELRGTMKLRHVGNIQGIQTYAVEDVNFTTSMYDQGYRIVGAGRYEIGSPGLITVIQHRMQLDLQVNQGPTQHFDSGWVMPGDLSRIAITVSINGMYCWDRVIRIDASRVSDAEIHHYQLASGATYEHGCCGASPCDCLCMGTVPMVGEFALVALRDDSLFREFAMVDIRWRVMSSNSTDPAQGIGIFGVGLYRVGGEVAVQQQMILDVFVSNTGPTHFDSGLVSGGFQFPRIDVFVSMFAMQPTCVDTILHVVAGPVVGNVICGGLAGTPCPEGSFCKLPEGACCCDFQGVCTPIPTGCPDVWDPVCGCDGVTYSNECDADAAGVSIAYRGECRRECGGDPTVVQCEPGEFCKFPIGDCQPSGIPNGVCTPVPNVCPAVYDPVCGCDGVTYVNECEADRARARIAHRGECREACGGFLGLPCPPGMFCKLPEGECCCDIPGICVEIPLFCPEYADPVCGCDGVTYDNECFAYAAGVSIDHRGRCEDFCGGIAGIPCGPGEFCKFPPGTCDIIDNQGVCVMIPGACPLYYDPVCGCDGRTYGNECEADAAGVSIDYRGECRPTTCAASRSLADPEPSYCPGTVKTVHIRLAPPNGTSAIGLEDTPPVGWVVSNISDGGFFDATNGKVKWGPLFPPFPSAVHYDVTPTSTADGQACFAGVISVDGINERICGDDCIERSCCPLMEADRPQPACAACPIGDCSSCSSDGCQNGRISLCEVIGYACAWLRGCHDDLAGMTRAAYIWRNGECYCWDNLAANWFPRPCSFPPGCCPWDGTAESTLAGSAVARVGISRGLRSGGGSTAKVHIALSPPEGASAAALELHVPDGWIVGTISDGGFWDETNRKVKWGVLFDDLSRSVTIELTRSAAPASRPAGLDGGKPADRFSGTVSFDGINQAVVVR